MVYTVEFVWKKREQSLLVRAANQDHAEMIIRRAFPGAKVGEVAVNG